MANILIVDDNPDIASLLAEIVLAAGHEARVANNGRQGLECVAERAPDLVLLDVEMPILTGPEMAYGLFLRDCGDEKIPVILLSGAVGLPLIAARVGTPYFLAKPYSPDKILQLVERALRERVPPRPRREEVS
jgi:CheY-like chemotaxis protein